jgi:hypothetical protein
MNVVPEAREALNRFKMEAANELDVFLLLKRGSAFYFLMLYSTYLNVLR